MIFDNRKGGGIKINMTSKQRAFLKSIAMTQQATFHIGKSTLTPEITKAVDEYLNANELIKISVLKNCTLDPHEIAQTISERTRSEVVQVIGKKIVLYRAFADKEKRKIILPS